MGRSWSPALADILGSALPALPTCGAAYSRICCEDGPRSGFRIHPATLDACLQLGAAIPRAAASTGEAEIVAISEACRKSAKNSKDDGDE